MGRLITVDAALPIAAWFARMSQRGAVFAMMMIFLAVGSASEHGNELAVATEVSHLLMNAPPLTQSLTFTLIPLIQSCVRSVLTAPSRMAAPLWTAADMAVQGTQIIINGAASTVADTPTKG